MFDKDVYSQHHLNRYLRFIESCKHQVIEGFCEKHHIKPRSLGGQDTFDNLVKLTYRQHFIAHLMLSKIFKGNSQIKMAHAAWNMVNRDGGIRTNSKTYSMLREKEAIFYQSRCVVKTIRCLVKNIVKNLKEPCL